MQLTEVEQAELARLEAAFEAAGGRDMDLADQIDALRGKARAFSVTVTFLVDPGEGDPDKVREDLPRYLADMLDIPEAPDGQTLALLGVALTPSN